MLFSASPNLSYQPSKCSKYVTLDRDRQVSCHLFEGTKGRDEAELIGGREEWDSTSEVEDEDGDGD